MLVFANNPRGVLYLAGYQIWGRETGRKPVDIPWKLYHAYREALQDATYREDVLRQLFGCQFPEVAFTYSELRWLPDKTLDRIGSLMLDDYDISWSHKKKVDQIKKRLTEVSPNVPQTT